MAVSHTRRPEVRRAHIGVFYVNCATPQLEGCASTKRTVAKTTVGSGRFVLVALGGGMPVHAQTPPYAATINQYCVTCHSATAKAGESCSSGDRSVRLPRIPKSGKKSSVRSDLAKCRRRDDLVPMLRRFAPSRLQSCHNWMRRRSARPYAGRPVIRRLNRTEYGNAIRDLLAFEMPASAELPDDGIAGGFDNIGDALSISPVLLERYLRVARKITDLAFGIGAASPVTDQFFATKTQVEWQGAGMPVGSRGGISVRYYFPRDGEYVAPCVSGRCSESDAYRRGPLFPDTRDREGRAAHARGDVPGRLRRTRGSCNEFRDWRDGARWTGRPGSIRCSPGPRRPAGRPASQTVRHRRCLGKRTRATAGGAAAARIRGDLRSIQFDWSRLDCKSAAALRLSAAANVSRISLRIQDYFCARAPCVPQGCQRRGFAAIPDGVPRRTIEEQLRRVDCCRGAPRTRRARLPVSTRIRFESDEPGSVYPLTPFELATRLSFFLWSSIPDDELLNVASSGKLVDPAVLKQQVMRMLADSAGAVAG